MLLAIEKRHDNHFSELSSDVKNTQLECFTDSCTKTHICNCIHWNWMSLQRQCFLGFPLMSSSWTLVLYTVSWWKVAKLVANSGWPSWCRVQTQTQRPTVASLTAENLVSRSQTWQKLKNPSVLYSLAVSLGCCFSDPLHPSWTEFTGNM